MNKIGEIYSANYEFTQSEKDDLELEYLCANTRLEKNKLIRVRFLKCFIALNLSIFIVQICYIEVADSDTILTILEIAIMLLGSALFLIDMCMILLFITTMNKFIELIHDKEKTTLTARALR